ncbi:hypothetical protein Gohar_002786 [Gossypium harknessii]|uniref:Reverse transcriptase zinc-binding domain-containing protein n=1 Tax=Gossypium harknessii TaxID=34285 RepID=A0A7J9HMH0_9ROSI|nr:hypothetical protein [Gossypium harknessii]
MESILQTLPTRGLFSSKLVLAHIGFIGGSFGSFRHSKKIYILAWRMGHELLPKNVKIPSIKNNVGWGCLRCRGRNETAIHALKDCLKARAILSHDGIDDRLLNYDYERCID